MPCRMSVLLERKGKTSPHEKAPHTCKPFGYVKSIVTGNIC